MTRIRAFVAASLLAFAAWGGSFAAGQVAEKAPQKPTTNGGLRQDDWLTMTIAGFPDDTSLHPKSDDPVRANDFVRVAVLMKDGSVHLHRSVFKEYDSIKERVAPPMRHRTPIRDLSFVAESRLLFTVSDDSVKLWDGVTGDFRKEILGQVVSPAYHYSNDRTGRFQTVDLAGRVVTTWDAKTMEPVSSFEFPGPRLVAAFQSEDARTLATVAEDGSVTLRGAKDGRPIATLAPGSDQARMVFDVKTKRPRASGVPQGFWIGTRSLLPREPNPAPKK